MVREMRWSSRPNGAPRSTGVSTACSRARRRASPPRRRSRRSVAVSRTGGLRVAKRLHIEAEALAELRESAHYIDDQSEGLGDALHDAVMTVLARILVHPESYRVVRHARGHEIRAALVRRFKFRIV